MEKVVQGPHGKFPKENSNFNSWLQLLSDNSGVNLSHSLIQSQHLYEK